MFGCLMATVKYYKSGKLLVIPAAIASAAALPGSWLGTRAAMAAGSQAMQLFMVFAIPIVGALVLLNKKQKEICKVLS